MLILLLVFSWLAHQLLRTVPKWYKKYFYISIFLSAYNFQGGPYARGVVFSLLICHLLSLAFIYFVTHDDDPYVSWCIVSNIFGPFFHSLERPNWSNIVDAECHICLFIVYRSNRSIPFLSSSVPYLNYHKKIPDTILSFRLPQAISIHSKLQ